MQKTNKKMAGANTFIGTCLICKQAKLSNKKKQFLAEWILKIQLYAV